MCYEAECAKCHKRSWAGCGRHAAGVMAGIPKEQQCQCKPVPGAPVPPTTASTPITKPLVGLPTHKA